MFSKKTYPNLYSQKNYKSYILESVGNTPCIEIDPSIFGCSGRIFLKLENSNPTGTIKDRYAKWVIENSDNQKLIDFSIGNYGVSLSWFASLDNRKATIFLPENIPLDVATNITKHGGNVIFSDKDDIEKINKEAMDFAKETNGFYSKQFLLEESVICSEHTIAEEISDFSKKNNIQWDCIIAPYGSGATLKGIKNKNKNSLLYSPCYQDFFIEKKPAWLNELHFDKKRSALHSKNILQKMGINLGNYGSKTFSVGVDLLCKNNGNILCIISD